MKKILIAYYADEKENIQTLAYNIHQYTNSDIYAIKTIDNYSKDYCRRMKQAKKELDKQIYPYLKDNIDISQYDILFLGYPIWWGTYPSAIASFLKDTNPYHQTIIPFSNESCLGHSTTDLKKMCPFNEVLPGLGIKSEYIEHSCIYIQDWLKRLELN